MVFTRLEGGLGNQMFQYAAARGLSTKKIYLDTTFLDWQLQAEHQTARHYELNIFPHLKAVRMSKFFYKFVHTKAFAGIRNFFLEELAHVHEKDHVHLSTISDYKHIYLNGWFQSEKYFASKKNELVKEFTFPELDQQNKLLLNSICSYNNSVSLHVRRGDYLSAGNRHYFETLPITYYRLAIDKIESHAADAHYFIFSDDTTWCEKHFSFLAGKHTIVANNSSDTAWKDMKLMTQCRHHVVANSSFSWWGAWLSTGNGLKMAPKTWFNARTVNYEINHFVPDSWCIVD